MSLADDTNAPIQYKGQTYKSLTMQDIGTLIESLPASVPRQLLPFVTITDAMKYGRSPYGLPHLMRIVSDNSGHDHARGLRSGDQLELAQRLTDRFYGYDDAGIDAEEDEGARPPEPFLQGPASSLKSPA